MALQRVYGQQWSIGEKLTSAQENAIDVNPTLALDKRSGQSDVFGSLIVATGAGRIAKTVQTGPDANTTFYVPSGNSIVRVPTLTAARTYTLGITGATGGDRISMYVEGLGPTPSGYADIINPQGTGLFRLGSTNATNFNDSAEGDSAEFIFSGGTWKLMYGSGPGMRHVEFISSGTWTCPPGVFEILLIGYGGGGGGGAGGQAPNSPTAGLPQAVVSGGGGGGGSQLRTRRVSVIPGRTYTITIGDGGQSDADGNDTTFSDLTFASSGLATTLASFVGASRGFRGGVATMSAPLPWPTGGVTGLSGCLAFGGAGARMYFVTTGTSLTPTGPSSIPTGHAIGVPTALRISFAFDTMPFFGPQGPGAGGPGVTNNFPPVMLRHGWYSTEGFAGGTAGTHGVNIAFYNYGGGGGGGGGAGGPGGIGGCGGTGGAAAQNGTPKAGTIGGTGAPNTGAGGGGGGGGGFDVANGASPPPGVGGQGGSGKLTAAYIK